MTGNPKASPWRSTPESKRKRKRVILTLGPDTLARLDAHLQATMKSKSAVVEDAILEYLDKQGS